MMIGGGIFGGCGLVGFVTVGLASGSAAGAANVPVARTKVTAKSLVSCILKVEIGYL